MAGMMTFTIGGKPLGKARPRFHWPSHGRIRVYTTKDTKSRERAIAWLAKAEMLETGRKPFTGSVKVSISALFGVPKSWPAKKRASALSGQLPHTSKPDGDNIAKLVLDALNGVAWADDAAVVNLSVSKRYTDGEPRTVVSIENARPEVIRT